MNATDLARAVIADLIAAGVTDLVWSPGSRNAPLGFAAYDAEAAGALRLHTRIDERTAGFVALGLSAVGARAAVLCTSGTAVANLHPAVMEAAHAGVDLVVVTADRPASVRGTGASQTTDQVGVFGAMARCVDVAAAADLAQVAWQEPGVPWHLNVQFAPPLVPTDRWTPQAPVRPERTWPQPTPEPLAAGPRTVVVAGDGAGPGPRILAQTGGWPLIAEPSSGARRGPNALRCGRLLLDGALGEEIERVVVAGHPTLSRPVTRLLERDDVEVVSIRAAGVWADRPFAVDREVEALVAEEAPASDWLDRWRDADAEVARRVDRLLADQPTMTPYDVAAAVDRATPPAGLLWVGASSPIRDLDLMAASAPIRERRKVMANRGVAGIDGTLSSVIGAALGRPHGPRNLALVGDVTFLHDANALILGPDEPTPDLTIVVVNDDGGSIFTMLEQGDEAYAAQYERLFGTPHLVDLASLCAATRTPHLRVDSVPALEQALAMPNGGIEVIEARVSRADRRALDAAIRGLAD